MVEQEQVSPLATGGSVGSNHEAAGLFAKKASRRKVIKCCGCLTAVIVVLAVVVIVLMFTVFRVKDPVIKMKGVTITKLELINGTVPKPGTNMSVIADVSVKNPNVASFRYSNTTTTIYYHDTVVGEARGPPGRAKARRTMRLNVTVDIITDRVLSSPNLIQDIDSGILTMSTYSRIGGRVNILNIVKKHVTVKMNCTIAVNISSRAIEEQNCKRKVDL